MATSLTKFKGGKELQDMLNTLPAKIERNIMRSALRAGAAVIRDAARANINDRSGGLSKSVRVSTRARRGEVTATVKAGNKEAFYAHMVEFGTLAHDIPAAKGSALNVAGQPRASVEHPGAAPHPFMRPAVDEKQAEAIRAVGEQVRKRLTKQGLNTPDALEVDDE